MFQKKLNRIEPNKWKETDIIDILSTPMINK